MNKKVSKPIEKTAKTKKVQPVNRLNKAQRAAIKKVKQKTILAERKAKVKARAKKKADALAVKAAAKQARINAKKAKLAALEAVKVTAKKEAAALAIKNAGLLKKFVPKQNLDHLSRGKEFVYLQSIGRNNEQILSLYRKLGIKRLAIPTIYNAIKIYKAPAFVRNAIRDGEIPASDALKILKPLREEGHMVEEAPEAYEARLREHLDELISEREQRRTKLEEAGFTNDEGQVKFTKMRTMAMVEQNLRAIKSALKNPRAAAIMEFTKALNDGATVEELMELARRK